MGLSIVKPCFSIVSTKSIVAPVEVGGAHPVDDDLDAAEVADEVAVEVALVEVELVASGPSSRRAGRATRSRRSSRPSCSSRLLTLLGGDVGELDAVRGFSGGLGDRGVGAARSWQVPSMSWSIGVCTWAVAGSTAGGRALFRPVKDTSAAPGHRRGDQVVATRAARARRVPTGSVIAASTWSRVSATA